MSTYTYTKSPVDNAKLLGQLQAAALPATDVQTSAAYAGQVAVIDSRDLTTAEQTTQANTVAAHDGRARQPRPLYAIRADVQALSAAQFSNAWNDLSSAVTGPPAVPRKYLTDAGPNAAAIFVMDHVIYVVQGTAAQIKAAQITLTSMYAQDNVGYLVNPPFDNTINIPGDQPVS